MPSHHYDSEDHENAYDGEVHTDDYDDDVSSVESYPNDDADDLDGESLHITPVVWKSLRIGNAVIGVSSNGSIRLSSSMFDITKGFGLLGTPYRTVPVELEKGDRREYYVHDLVWRAFNGEPPSGWEVRHTYTESLKRRKYYDNSLKNITITPATVEVRPVIVKET